MPGGIRRAASFLDPSVRSGPTVCSLVEASSLSMPCFAKARVIATRQSSRADPVLTALPPWPHMLCRAVKIATKPPKVSPIQTASARMPAYRCWLRCLFSLRPFGLQPRPRTQTPHLCPDVWIAFASGTAQAAINGGANHAMSFPARVQTAIMQHRSPSLTMILSMSLAI